VSAPASRIHPEDDIAPGDLLAGKYQVERVLGRGGMGVVVAARNLELDQRVAIKRMHAALAKNPTAVERFLREGRAAVQLRSEHAAKVLDVGRLPDGVPFMVLEYLEGQDLSERLAERGALSPREAAHYLVQACEAVADAHSLGIVHRDLKPENLFLAVGLGGEPVVKVLDFGVSKRTTGSLSALTQAMTVVGSPMYMAPEQLRAARDLDARCDVWALGVTLRELLTGRMPFEADTVPELTIKIALEAPRPIDADRPGLPRELVAIVDRCLSKDRAARFAHAGEVATALRAYLHGAGIARSTQPSAPGPDGPASHERPQAVTVTSAPAAASRWPWVTWAAVAMVALGGSALSLATIGRAPLPAASPAPMALSAPAPAPIDVSTAATVAAAAPVVAAPSASSPANPVAKPRKQPPPRRTVVVKNDEIPSMR
jgi:serine/threonine-protein kinase